MDTMDNSAFKHLVFYAISMFYLICLLGAFYAIAWLMVGGK